MTQPHDWIYTTSRDMTQAEGRALPLRDAHRDISGDDPMLIDTESLRISPTTRLFEGGPNGGVELSIFQVDYPPGGGVRLHLHPDPEVFVIETGEATFHVDGQEIKAVAGQILVAPANKPHRFTNTGPTGLRAVNVLPRDAVITIWLEDER